MKLFWILIIMATTYFVEPGIGNDANAGTSQGAGNSWATFQKAADTAIAGDTVKLIGTETLAAIIDIDTNAGSVASGLIKFIGVNSSGTNDGTMYVVDGNSAVANCIRAQTTSKNFLYFENIECKNSTARGWYWAVGADYWILKNCWAHNCGGAGFDVGGNPNAVNFLNCRSYSNTAAGILSIYGGKIIGGVYYSNSTSGITCANGPGSIRGSVVWSNTTSGITTGTAANLPCAIEQCTINNNATGIIVNSTQMLMNIYNNRITNNATAGVSLAAGKCANEDWNAFGGNGTDKSVNAAALLLSGANSQTGITIGYNNAGAGDFNLTSSATLRRTAENQDSTNIMYQTAGLIPTDSGGGGGSGSIIIYD